MRREKRGAGKKRKAKIRDERSGREKRKWNRRGEG